MNLVRRLVLLLTALAALSAADERPIVFRGVTILDGADSGPRRQMDVVVAGGRIVEVGRKARAPKDARSIDARGKFLIPGLWDMHVHLAFPWSSPVELWEPSLWLFLANGVTGVRDMGSDWVVLRTWRDKIEAGSAIGPRIVAAGPILDGPTPGYPGRITVNNAAEARDAVELLSKRGVDFIKVHANLSRDSYLAIAGEAKKRGLPFAGHVTQELSAAEASDAGQKSMEHVNEGGLVLDCSSEEAELRKNFDQQRWLDTYDPGRCQALFERFRRNGTWQSPTVVALRAFSDMDEDRRRNLPLMKYVPQKVQALQVQYFEMFFKNRTDGERVLARRIYAKQLEMVGQMGRSGVRILTGTDVAMSGFGVHDEMELLVKAGLTPAQALRAATRNPAEFLGRLDTAGSIDAGKTADLVLLDSDPLADIRNTRKIAAVVVRGKLFTRSDLHGLLARAEEAAR
jgi:imidazolonepropionase-like amidohydrolase